MGASGSFAKLETALRARIPAFLGPWQLAEEQVKSDGI